MKLWSYNLAVISFFIVLSRLIAHFLPFEFPSSIIGLLLLFVALNSGLLKPAYAEKICTILNKYIGVLFVPSGVGLMHYFDLVSDNLAALLITAFVSTLAVFFTVGKVYSLLDSGDK